MIPMLSQEETFVDKYQFVNEYTEAQLKNMWFASEIKVDGDIQSIRVDMTDSERHGFLTVLKLFTLYELRLGKCAWGSRFVNSFARPEFSRLGHTFAMVELAVHKVFYSKINELLFIDNDSFYLSYKDIDFLNGRVNELDNIMEKENLLTFLGCLCLTEGSVLISSFAFIKSFQNNGNNKMLNINRGIDSSLQDETIHCNASAAVFRQLKSEMEEADEYDEYIKEAEYDIYEFAKNVVSHEDKIIDMIFEKGSIDGISPHDLKDFVRSRVDECLLMLGLKKIFDVKSQISKWFDGNLSLYKSVDFFTSVSSEYGRGWDSERFTW